MQTYLYKAKNKDGELVHGKIEALEEEGALSLLVAQDLVPISITDQSQQVDLTSFEPSKHVSAKELMVFTKQVAGMIGAGMPPVESFTTIIEDEKNRYFKSVVEEIAQDVDGGSSLANALRKYPNIFSEIYVNMVEVGESSGKISETLARLADQLEKDYRLEQQIKGAMIYPIFILVTLIAVSLMAVTYVFPKLMPILTQTQTKLPFSTKIIISFSTALLNYWFLIIPAIFGVIIFTYIFTRKGPGRSWWDEAKVHIPIAGDIIKDIYMTRYLRTLTILISGGVNILEALEITSKAIGNVHYEADILRARDKITGGGSLFEAVKDSPYMTSLVKKMIKTGEKTGTLNAVTDQLADFYQAEVNDKISNLDRAIEPILVLIMGVAVAFFVSAVIIPLYDATMSVGKM